MRKVKTFRFHSLELPEKEQKSKKDKCQGMEENHKHIHHII